MAQPKRLIAIGFLLVLFGFVTPFLMILGVITSTFALNFISYAASISGLFLGMYGATMYVRINRNRDN
jgi:putative Mn2+ efflux pump MntP